MNNSKPIKDLNNEKKELTPQEKLRRIKSDLDLWEINEGISKKDAIEANIIFREHWRILNLLDDFLDEDAILIKKVSALIDGLWKMNEERKERKITEKEEVKDKRSMAEVANENERKVKIKFKISCHLWEKINQFIKENPLKKLNVNSIFNQALIAYKHDLKVNSQVEISKDKKIIYPRLKLETFEIYQQLPEGEKRKKIEIILASYLENESTNKII